MTEQTKADLLSDFHNTTLRIDKIIYLPCAVAGEAAGDTLTDFIEYDLSDEITNHQLAIPGLKGVALEEIEGDVELIASILFDSRDPGFLAQAAHPDMRFGPRDGCTYSWGNYYTRWFYGLTMEDIMKQAITWADALDAKNKAKAK